MFFQQPYILNMVCLTVGFPGGSVQFSHSIVSDSLQPHGLQHARLPCPSLEVAQTHVHRVGDAIQPSHPLSSPGDSVVKNPPVNAGDTGSIPGSGRSSGRGNGNPLQYSCLGNPMDREA